MIETLSINDFIVGDKKLEKNIFNRLSYGR